MTASIETLHRRGNVRSGALLLDSWRPGWADEVNLKRLDMLDPNDCVIGQVFGDFDEGCDELGIYNEPFAQSGFGFMVAIVGDHETEREQARATTRVYRELTKLWRREVLARTTGRRRA